MTEVARARPRVSVVIPALNEAATIRRTIEALLVDVSDLDVEIIVADGRSTDTTRDVVASMARLDERIQLVDNAQGIIPAGLNAAILASHGDVIVRMDAHAVPDPGYLAACLRVLAESGAWDVGGVMRKTGETAAARAASAAATSPFGIGAGRRFHLANEAADLDGVWLGCWPRWVLERVGLFDPDMVVDEDEELSQRIIDAGGRIRFDPSISATYLSRSSWRGLFRQYARYGLYKVRAIQKRPSIFRWRHLAPAAFVAVVAVGAISAVVGPLGPGLAVAAVLAWLVAAVMFARRVAGDFGASQADVVAAYACLHVGYGIGLWMGLIRFAPSWFIDRRGIVPALPPRSHG